MGFLRNLLGLGVGSTSAASGDYQEPTKIPTDELTSADIPVLNPADLDEAFTLFGRFAHSFDPYPEMPNWRDVGAEVRSVHAMTGDLSDSVDALRAAVLLEQRAWHHRGSLTDVRELDWAEVVLARLREILPPPEDGAAQDDA